MKPRSTCQFTPEKVRYTRSAYAWLVGAKCVKERGVDLYIYRCSSCEGWHLSSKGEYGGTKIVTHAELSGRKVPVKL